MASEKEKMLSGELYYASDTELLVLRAKARTLLSEYNLTPYEQTQERRFILEKLLGGFTGPIDIQAPFYCDYGFNIFAGENLYMNFNCVILDCARVTFGKNVFLGPNVQIYTASHPLQALTRSKGLESARPIHIGDNVWLGGGAIVLPGVSIGNNTTIGAGSVVTKNIPDNVLAVGNPCKVVREI
jgi:maltose O-acetyltransferase